MFQNTFVYFPCSPKGRFFWKTVKKRAKTENSKITNARAYNTFKQTYYKLYITARRCVILLCNARTVQLYILTYYFPGRISKDRSSQLGRKLKWRAHASVCERGNRVGERERENCVLVDIVVPT